MSAQTQNNPAAIQNIALPDLGDAVPNRGNPFSKVFGRIVLRLTGWRLEGELPDLPRFVIIAAPHTSNWDFVYGMSCVFAIGLSVKWMGKDSLFKPPFGGVMRALGGIPIERSEKHGVVESMAEEFNRHDKLVVAITPEGTRGRVQKWKTGFYYIAEKAGLPIVTGFIDYKRKCMGFGPMITPGGDIDEDLKNIRSFYSTITGKRQELFNPDAIRKQ